ncbi:MAG: hypothetical protein RSF40_01580 [Oscillospiraceae bacterium]
MIKSASFPVTIDGDRCIKVRNLLEDMSSGQSKLFKKYNFALGDFRVAQICLRELWDDGKTECVHETVMKMFKSFGFAVKDKGIGWEIK